MQIELGRWYENIASHKFGLGSDEAQEAARDFMDDEVNSHPLLAKYRYKYSAMQDARIDVLDDKVIYAVPVSYQTTNPEYLDDMDHCGRPSSQGVMVLIDTLSGRVFGWLYATCE